MTTIAYRNGVMAGDTRVSDKQMIYPCTDRKVFRLRDGSLLGIAGDSDECEILVKHMRKGLPLPKMENCEALHVHTDGRVFRFEGKGWSLETAKYHATGSGRRFAYVAMRCGKSAPEAVKIAMEFDAATGGRVTALALKRRRKR